VRHIVLLSVKDYEYKAFIWRKLRRQVTHAILDICVFGLLVRREMQAMSGEILQGEVNPLFPGLQPVRLQALRATLLSWEGHGVVPIGVRWLAMYATVSLPACSSGVSPAAVREAVTAHQGHRAEDKGS